jgi:two-component sensor histidine kinase
VDVREIAELKKKSQLPDEQSRSKAMKQRIEASAELGIGVVDGDSARWLEVGGALAGMGPTRSRSLVGLPAATDIAEPAKDLFNEAFARAVEFGEAGFECRRIRNDGTTFEAEHRMVRLDSCGEGTPRVIVAVRDLSKARTLDRAVKVLSAELGTQSGVEFFASVTRFVAHELGVRFAFIGLLLPGGDQVRTLAVVQEETLAGNFTYDTQHTPCENVLERRLCFHPREVQQLFPDDHMLVEMGAESYIGIPIIASGGKLMGLMAVLHDAELGAAEYDRFNALFQILGERLAFEIERGTYVAEIEKSLSEKDTLLREIHHRVKNNMAMASSILNLQASTTQDGELVDALLETRGRLQTMALHHEHLYRVPDFDLVPAKVFLRNVLEGAMSLFKLEDVEVTVSLVDVLLPADTLLPIGLILNELLTNALKHACTGGNKGRLELALFELSDDGLLGLKVSDNGPPFDMASLDGSTGLGVQLVSNLARQIRGTVDWKYKDGCSVSLLFPKPLRKS